MSSDEAVAPSSEAADERAPFMNTMGHAYRMDGDRGHGQATITDYLRAAPGWPRVSALLTFADVLIGVAAAVRTAPRISVTSSLSVYMTGVVPEDGGIELFSTLTRSGRSLTVGETRITARGSGELVAFAVGAFQASPRPQDSSDRWSVRLHNHDDPNVVSVFPTLADHVGLEVLEPGVATIALRPDLANGTGVLQGGLVALLGEVAAQSAASDALGDSAVVQSLEVHYTAAARVGPFRARAEALGPDLWRVATTDAGMEDRTVSLITARTRPAPS